METVEKIGLEKSPEAGKMAPHSLESGLRGSGSGEAFCERRGTEIPYGKEL